MKDRVNKLVAPEWLFQRVICAKLDRHGQEIWRAIPRVRERATRHCNDRDRRIETAQFPDGRDAFHFGHEDIDDDDIESLRLEKIEADTAIARDDHVETLSFQDRFDRGSDITVIVNDEDRGHPISPTGLLADAKHCTATSSGDSSDSNSACARKKLKRYALELERCQPPGTAGPRTRPWQMQPTRVKPTMTRPDSGDSLCPHDRANDMRNVRLIQQFCGQYE
jgi:hypothetical protein